MTFSRITRALSLVTLLGSSLAPLQAMEVPDLEDLSSQSTRFDDLPEDIVLEVIKFMPDHDTARLGLTSKALNATSTKALRSMVHGMTLNRGVGEQHHLLQDLPTSRVHQILGQIIIEDQYLAVPMNSDLCTLMPETLKLAELDDWRENLALAMPLYEAAFGKDFPDNHVDLALQHLLAVLETRVYVQRGNVNQSFARFATKKAQSLMQSLQNQRQARPFVNLLHGDIDVTLLGSQAHTMVLSDAELDQPETKQRLEELLATQTEESTHHVMLSVGNSPAKLENDVLTMGSDNLPSNVRHLTVTNPTANLRGIGGGFLEITLLRSNNDGLTKLRLAGFQNVTIIPNSFLSGCSSLTSVDLFVFKNVTQMGSSFLSGCSGLTNVDLSAFKNVTHIGNNFLRDCSGLVSVDLSELTDVTSIGDYFLRDCSGLTSVDLSSFKNVATIGWAFLSRCTGLTSVDLSSFKNVAEIGLGFLSGCTGLVSVDLSELTKVKRIDASFIAFCHALTTAAQEHIRAFCKQRGFEWSPPSGGI